MYGEEGNAFGDGLGPMDTGPGNPLGIMRTVPVSLLVDQDAAERAVKALLTAIGEDPDREGLQDTPRRVARFWCEFMDYDPGNMGAAFGQVESDQLVVVSGIRVWSLCEHHLLPFHCDITAAYLIHDKMMGLSKIARVAHKHAHRLQVQERLVSGIADDLAEMAGHGDVAVVGSGVHLCMVMRGIKTPGTMQSSALRGAFKSNPTLRAEFMQLHALAMQD